MIRVCYPFVGDSVGGAQMSTLSLIRALPPEAERLVVVHQEGVLAKLLTAENVPFIGLPLPRLAGQQPTPLRQFQSMLSVAWPLRRFLQMHRIDVVHTQDGRMHASWWFPAKLAGVPQVWHQRSPFVPSRLLSFMVRRAPAVVANSETARTSLPVDAAAAASVIANPVDPPRPGVGSARDKILRHAADAGVVLASDTIVIAAVGNLRAVKQPQLLAHAAARVAGLTGRSVVLALFGDDREGWIPRMSEIMQPAGRANLVHFGFRHPIEDWLRGCDVLVATSNGDAFGRSVVEAMGVGVPAIAVDAGGHRETMTNDRDGLLVPDGNPDALARAIASVMADPALRQRLVGGGRARAGDFAPGAHAAKIMAVYRALV